MPTLYKPTVESLEALKKEAFQGGAVSPEEWRAKVASGCVKMLLASPQQYRSYGPFWWQLKRELLAQGDSQFGDHLDAEWLELTEYGDPVLNLLACIVHANWAIEQGLIYSSRHPVAFIQDDGSEPDIQEYVLIDEDLEIRTAGTANENK